MDHEIKKTKMVLGGWESTEWRNKNGVRHRLDGPAIESSSGQKEWLVNGIYHRDDGPAIEWADGMKEWMVHGKHHRLDGPARFRPVGLNIWVINLSISYK